MKILVADDEEMLVRAIEFRLKREGHEIIKAYDGKQASQLLKEELPDMLITDIMMPFITGLELVTLVRNELKSQIHIMVLSVTGQETKVIESFNLGADEFMPKPFNPNELVIRVKKLLAQKK